MSLFPRPEKKWLPDESRRKASPKQLRLKSMAIRRYFPVCEGPPRAPPPRRYLMLRSVFARGGFAEVYLAMHVKTGPPGPWGELHSKCRTPLPTAHLKISSHRAL